LPYLSIELQQSSAVDRIQINVHQSIAIGWAQCSYKSANPSSNLRNILIGMTAEFFLATMNNI